MFSLECTEHLIFKWNGIEAEFFRIFRMKKVQHKRENQFSNKEKEFSHSEKNDQAIPRLCVLINEFSGAYSHFVPIFLLSTNYVKHLFALFRFPFRVAEFSGRQYELIT